jgi:hypothetical protein
MDSIGQGAMTNVRAQESVTRDAVGTEVALKECEKAMRESRDGMMEVSDE